MWEWSGFYLKPFVRNQVELGVVWESLEFYLSQSITLIFLLYQKEHHWDSEMEEMSETNLEQIMVEDFENKTENVSATFLFNLLAIKPSEGDRIHAALPIDIRPTAVFKRNHVKNSINIPLNDGDEISDTLLKKKCLNSEHKTRFEFLSFSLKDYNGVRFIPS